MVEKITISPAEVRGYGDIVSPKTTEDFTNYRSALTETEGLYTLTYDIKGVTLTVDSASIEYGESVVLTATAIDEGLPAVGETITFYQGGTVLGTDTTGDDGKAEYTVTGLSVGSYSFTAEYDIYTSNTVNVTVNKLTSTITLASDKSVVASDETYTLSGVLSVGSGESVKLYNGNTLVDTVTTGTGGAFTKTITATGSGVTLTYRAVYDGDSTYESATSSNVSVTVLSDKIMELSITGNSFSTPYTHPFDYTGRVYIDWGDNTFTEYAGGFLSHSYSSSGNYNVKIYGNITSLRSGCFHQCSGLTSIILPDSVTSLGNSCFEQCTGLTSIILPDSVTSLGNYCFEGCTGLTELILEWDSASEIVSYNSNWLYSTSSFNHFLIPEGTTSLYTAKSYPSNLLKEDGDTPVPASIDLTGTKSILSYADSESSVLTATVLDSSDNPVEGVDVNLYNGSTLWDTLTTDSSGECSKTYSSAGVGDITFTAEVDGTLLTKTFALQDCSYYNDGSSVGSLEIGSGAICTSNGSYITLTTNTSGEKDVKLPVTLTGDWEFTTDIAELGTNQDLTFKVGSGSQWGAVDHSTNRITVNLGSGSNYYTKTISKDDTLKITYVNGSMSVYWNDEYLTSRTVSISGKMGYYQVSGRTYHIKNIKLKAL